MNQEPSHPPNAPKPGALAPASTPQSKPEVRIAAMHDLDHFQSCVDVQLAVWGYSDGDLIPRRVFLLADRIGGQVFGAFDGDKVVAFAMALPGFRNRQPYLHSHMLAVLPEYRNLGLGRQLKLAQREDALTRGFDLIEWTFDPLEIKNAHLNIARLGAICRRYQPDFYGPSSSPLQGGLPTDRLYAEWWLRSPRVVAHLARAAKAEQGTSDTPNQVAVPGTVASPEIVSPEVFPSVIVPHELNQWKQQPETRQRALDVQRGNRDALQSAFSRGLAVTGYLREPNGDGCFLLGPILPGDFPGDLPEGLPESPSGS